MKQILTRALLDGESRAGAPGDPLRFIITTTGKKRDGLDLKMDRFMLENFQRNPVLLWMHGREARGSLPIGRWQNLQRSNTQITGEAIFDQDDEFAREVERKYRAQFLNTVSVSWLPERAGNDWNYDMLEASAVGIPADPDALLVGRAFTDAITEFECMVRDAAMEARRREALETIRGYHF